MTKYDMANNRDIYAYSPRKGKATTLIFILIFFLITQTLAWAGTNTSKAAHYLQKATQYYNQKDFAKAEKLFRKISRLNVAVHDEFYYFYGVVQAKVNKLEQALKNLHTYIKMAGKNGRFYAKAHSLSERIQNKINKRHKQRAIVDTSNQNNSSKGKQQSITPNMVKIEKGIFTMGTVSGDDDQKPPKKIKIARDFAISKSEITFAEYDRFAKETGKKLPDDEGWGRGNRPVINVSFNDALAYTRWLSNKNGRTYRLPTEAEWEYVAQAKKQRKSVFGYQNLIFFANANSQSGRSFWESAETKQVGSYKPNPLGLNDIFGNVWEWTCSAYTHKYDGSEQYCIPAGKVDGKSLAVRGGSWRSNDSLLRSHVRYNNLPDFYHDDLGFRIVEELR